MHPQLMTLLQQNRFPEAKALCARLCADNPGNAQIQFLMSAICGQLGDFSESETHCRKTLSINPNIPEAWYNLAVAQLRLEKTSAAIKSLSKAIALKADFPEAVNELGNAYQRSGKHSKAIEFHQRAIELKPDFVAAHHNLAQARQQLGETDEAARHFQSAISIQPGFADARVAYGQLLLARGNKESALNQFNAVPADLPGNLEHLQTMAASLKAAGYPAEATGFYEKALALNPRDARLLSNHGLVLIALHRPQEAAEAIGRAIDLEPGIAEYHYNHAIALNRCGRQLEAEQSYLKAISIQKRFPEAWMNLGTLQLLQGRVEEARASLENSLRMRPDYPEAASNLLMAINYDKALTKEQIWEKHRAWGAKQAARHARESHPSNAHGRARLRIGFVSPDFRSHSVAFFFQSLLDGNREQVEIFCYSNTPREDSTTEAIRVRVDGWRDITRLNDTEASRLIEADRLDALIDLAGHTSNNRLGVFALRPCSTQITYLGYPNTTGLAQMDFRITDELADTKEDQPYHSEELAMMPRCFLCYVPPPDVPEPTIPGSRSGQPITFGSFNNAAKLSMDTIELWAQVLASVPGSRLVLKAAPLGDEAVADRYRKLFAQHGVTPDRLDFLGRLPDREHWLAYNQIDIALDTYPYHGTTTTCEALWMGRPVVTLKGDCHAARVGASLLSAVQLDHLVAGTPQEFNEISTGLAHTLQSGDHDYADLRARMRASPLCNKTDFQQHFFSLVARLVR